jgi:chaperonin GroES
MATKLKPTDDHIVVKADQSEEKTKSGIYIPSTASKERPQMGEVVAVGPGKMSEDGKRLTMEVKVGDKVLFSKYGPSEVKIDGEELLILNQGDVLAIVE